MSLAAIPGSAPLLRVFRHPMGRVGGTIVLAFLAIAVLAPLVAPYDPALQDFDELMPPGLEHWLGTDQFGRDVLSRVLYASRVAITVGTVAALLGGSVGVAAGLAAGYFQSWVDTAVMRAADIVLAFPGLLVALLFVVVLEPGLGTVSVALAIATTPIFARITRASVLQLREREFVLASIQFGGSTGWIMRQHLLRNCASPIIVQASLVIGISVLSESGLSFLGLGIQPPTPSWGLMLNESRGFLDTAPWLAIAPGCALSLFLVGLVFLSDALRDVLDVGDIVERPR
jgi:peptide/nickel transport system permease protein